MKELNIGKAIAEKRKEKGITQEALASYMGVSKASVSKWETDQSYPDVIFLPQLATYFNITVDELLGYSPQMTKADIKALYHDLAASFASKPYEDALAECHAVIKKYYSCFPLLLQMSILYMNHCMLAPTPEKLTALLEEAASLCRRIKDECGDIWITGQANSVEAICLMMMQKPTEVIDLLEGAIRPEMGEETVLANAYLMAGDAGKAKETLQVSIYQSMIVTLGNFSLLASLYADNPAKTDEVVQRTCALIDTFDLEHLYVNCAAIYLSFAQMYVTQGNTDKCFEFLQKYADLCASLEFPLELHGDSFFDLLDPWLKDLDLGTDTPRNGEVVKASMLQGVVDNPAFATLAEDARYKIIVKNLKLKIG